MTRQLIKNGNEFRAVMEAEMSNMLALSGEVALCIQDGVFILLEGRSTASLHGRKVKKGLPINHEPFSKDANPAYEDSLS